MKIRLKSLLLSFLFVSYVCPFLSDSIENPEKMTDFQKDLERLKRGYSELQERIKNVPAGAKQSAFMAQYQNISALFGGKATEELFDAGYLNYLNHNIITDTANFLRTTVDYFVDVSYGKQEKPRILFHDTWRFRYKWGRLSNTATNTIVLQVGDTSITASGVNVNRHLLWTRENWLLFALGNLDNPNYNYIKLGIFPYELGRGISYGLAYRQAGFLGFATAFNVDQFAPAILIRFNPIPETLFLDTYVAITQNPNDSAESTSEPVRIGQTGCIERGIGQQTYLVALKAFWKAVNKANSICTLEPYIMYFQAPGQGLEFRYEVDSQLATFGLSVEGRCNKCNWGAEAAFNHGVARLPEYDRNFVTITKNSDGIIQEFYSKVFTQDPAVVDSPALAPVTDENTTIVKNLSVNAASFNGKQITPGVALYNAYDRFIPEQQFLLQGGYMLIADATYECIDDTFYFTCGAGYSSGDLDKQPNLNTMTTEQLLNQQSSAFKAVESVYSGDRLRHLIILNQGVPRFSTENPNDPHFRENVNPALIKVDEDFRNLAFVGIRPEIRIPSWKNYKFVIAPNVISYFCPATPITKCGTHARHYMGTEFTTEVTAELYKKLKFYSYFGFLFPGSYYKDMCGTMWGGAPTGSGIAYLINMGVNYSF